QFAATQACQWSQSPTLIRSGSPCRTMHRIAAAWSEGSAARSARSISYTRSVRCRCSTSAISPTPFPASMGVSRRHTDPVLSRWGITCATTAITSPRDFSRPLRKECGVTLATQREDVEPAPEARSGLDAWKIAELPKPPTPHGLGWINAVGPGVIALGASIGSGEVLLGPAAFVKYGLSLLWVVGVASLLQTLLNVELMRYTLATGEPVFTGFMRTRPHSTFWAWFYSILYFLQMGWPGWAGAAAGAVFFLVAKRLPGAGEAGLVYGIGVGLFLLCGLMLMVGRRIERTLEYLNWIMVSLIIGGLGVLAIIFVPLSTWGAAIAGFAGFDVRTSSFQFLPAGADFFLLGAFAAYCGGGGGANLTLTQRARDT